jgi:23S rRNA pseudouridine2605 synthase
METNNFNEEGQNPEKRKRTRITPGSSGERRPLYSRRPDGGSEGYTPNYNSERTPRTNDSRRREGGFQRDTNRSTYGSGGGRSGNGRPYQNNTRPKPNKSFRPKQEYLPPPEPIYVDAEYSDEMRLNKFIAQSGVCARRKADEIIKSGRVLVNGIVVTEMGVRVKQTDTVTLDGNEIKPVGKLTYVLMNKPKNTLTTTEDPKGRKTVLDLVQGVTNVRLYPVGRLDRNTTGILLMTNDGDLAKKLSHPSHMVKKVYHVVLDKDFSIADFNKVVRGEVELEEGKVLVDDIAYVTESKSELGVQIHIGWNRVIRRMFEKLGYKVTALDRVMFADMTKKNLPRGKFRFLTEPEVITLKHLMK